jgi:hypothetical protein
MYLSISLLLSVDHSLCIYMCMSAVFVFVSLCKGLCLCPPGHIMQTQRTHWQFLMVVALNEVKWGVMYWDRSNCMKRQEEQGYCDVSKYLSILLSIWLYINLYLCCLSVWLSVYLSKNYAFVLQATSWILRRPPWKLLLSVALHQNKCGVMNWESSNYMKRQEEKW